MLRRLFFALAALGAATPLMGQVAPGGSRVSGYMSRDDLSALVVRLDGAIRAPAYSERFKARAKAQAAEVRSRLDAGDFQVGDRVLLVVQGESALSDTFTVGQGNELLLPVVGAIPLRGVLHAELESHVTAQLARRIREPRVQARPMVRIAIEGAVARPGFYSVPVGALLGDALMAAGGLAPTGRADEARLERSGRDVLSATAFRQAVVLGRTLDQLDVRAGDRVVVPARGVGLGGIGQAEGAVRTLGLLISLPLTVFALTQVF